MLHLPFLTFALGGGSLSATIVGVLSLVLFGLVGVIAGLLDLNEGQIWIENDNVTWKEPKDRHIGMVFQSYALYPSMTVEKNLSFGLRMMNVNKGIIQEKIKKAIQKGDRKSVV